MLIHLPSNSTGKPINIFAVSGFLFCVAMLLIASACTQSEPTPTPTPSPTAVPIPTSTAVPTSTATPAPPSTPSATSTPEPTPTPDEDGIIWFEYEENPATITVEASTIIFEGDIGLNTYRDFLVAVRGKEDQITAIRVNSGGGTTDEGIQIGEWIFEHGIDVIVDEICFSSCANYIFTAGRNKIIEKDAIVGWHGSEQQEPFIAAGYGITMEELYRRNYDEMKEWSEIPIYDTKEEFVQSMLENDEYDDDDEEKFLDATGVNLYLMVYGFLPDQFDYYFSDDTHFGGWTFSIEDMAKFEVHNVTYEGEGQYPSEKAIENFPVAVFEVPTDTVPAAVVPTPLLTAIPPPGSTPTPTPDPELESESDLWVEPPPATISVEGDAVVIDGYLNHNAFFRFRSEIVGNEDEITTVRINSDFGLPDQAILIGFWVYDNDVDVVVDEVCSSACANYIFTAGKNKIIEDFAIVGWHDSPQRRVYEAHSLGMSVEELIRRDTSDDSFGTGTPKSEQEREILITASLKYFETEIEREQEFLDWIGLKEDVLVYGFWDVDFNAEFLPLHLFEGWTFSIDDMAKLGIDNVIYNGEYEYPSLLSTIERSVTVFEVP